MTTNTSAVDSLHRTTTPPASSTSTTTIQACSTKQTRVLGQWAISFYFGDQEYWTEDKGAGHVESHITNVIFQLRGPK
jgi:hypothetical protein